MDIQTVFYILIHGNTCTYAITFRHAVKVPRLIISPRPKTAMVHLLNWFHFAELGPPILPMKNGGNGGHVQRVYKV